MKSAFCILSILIFAFIAVAANDFFSGKWKGEIAAGPCRGFGAPGGGGGSGGGGFPGGGAPGGGGGRGGPSFNFLSEAGQRGGGFPGGGATGGGFPGGSGADRTGAKKVTLNIKAKEDKKAAEIRLGGNITIGETTEDVRDGRIDGVKITFTTGKPPNPVCQYAGELNPETKELRMTRTTMGSTAPGIPLTLKR